MAKKVAVAVSVLAPGPRPRPKPAEQVDGGWASGTTYDHLRVDTHVSAYGARVDSNLRSQDRWGYPEDLDPEDGYDY